MKLSSQYHHLFIKDYYHWTLVLNEWQNPYPGRCYAWWKDKCPSEGEGLHIGDLPSEALLELQTIFNDVARACGALGYMTEPYGREFLLNLCYLANMQEHNHHMHVHFVPRSAHPITIREVGLATKDKYWG